MDHICDDHLLRKILLKRYFVFRSMGHATLHRWNYPYYLLSLRSLQEHLWLLRVVSFTFPIFKSDAVRAVKILPFAMKHRLQSYNMSMQISYTPSLGLSFPLAFNSNIDITIHFPEKLIGHF